MRHILEKAFHSSSRMHNDALDVVVGEHACQQALPRPNLTAENLQPSNHLSNIAVASADKPPRAGVIGPSGNLTEFQS